MGTPSVVLLQEVGLMLSKDSSPDGIRTAKLKIAAETPCTFPEAQARVEALLGKPTAEQPPLTFFESVALPLVKRGWRVVPCLPKDKQVHTKLVPRPLEQQSAEPTQIHAWAMAEPNANVCVYAEQREGGLLFLDKDGAINLREKYERETGKPFPKTLLVRSSVIPNTGVSKGHWYFQQTPKTMALAGNIAESKTGGVFSLRIHNQYVASIGSLHPATGQPYTIVEDYPVIPMPDDLLDWLLKQVVDEKPTANSERRLLTYGQLHGAYVAEAGRLLRTGYDPEKIPELVLDWLRDNVQENVVIDEKKVLKEAKDVVERYERGSAPEVQKVAISGQEESESEEEEDVDANSRESFPECPIFPGTLTELARALYPSLPLEFKQWGLITRWGLMRSGIDAFGLETHVQPRFYSVFVSYPNIGKTACINETRKAMEIISTMVKGIGNKTPRVCGEVEAIPSVDSGQFFSDEFSRLVKKAKDISDKGGCSDLSGKMLLDPDELSDVFEKGRVTQGRVSTMFIELLKLHSGNRTGSGTKRDGNNAVTNAHLAILAGTTVRKYPMLWTGTGGGADGLVSRFIPITTNNPPVPPIPLPSEMAAAHKAYERLARLAQLPGQTIQLTAEASKVLVDWWNSFDNGKESATRVLEAVKQLLIVLAVTNLPDHHEGTAARVGVELVAPAIKFGEYVIAVRERLNPGDSWSHVQAMENAIVQWAKKNASRNEPKTMREFRRGIHAERMPGGLGTFKLAWRNCIDTEVLKLREKAHVGGRFSL